MLFYLLNHIISICLLTKLYLTLARNHLPNVFYCKNDMITVNEYFEWSLRSADIIVWCPIFAFDITVVVL